MKKLILLALLSSLFCRSLHASGEQFEIQNVIDPSAFQCTYLIITPDTFETSAQKLAEYRTHPGYRLGSPSRYITLSTLYEAFPPSDTVPHCFAISRFLRYLNSYSNLKYVVLLGDACFPEDSIVGGIPTPRGVPTFCTHVKNAITTEVVFSDLLYLLALESRDTLDLDSVDVVTNYSIGRIPCEKNEHVDTYLQKLRYFEENRLVGPHCNTAVYLTDDLKSEGKKDYNYVEDIEELTRNTMRAWENVKVYGSSFELDSKGMQSHAREAYLEIMEEKNPLWSVYEGHGYPGGLSSEQLLRMCDMDSLGSRCDPYIFLSLSCMNGAYQEPYANSMCKHGLFSAGGPVAYIGATRLMYFSTAFRLFTGFLERHNNQPKTPPSRLLRDVFLQPGGQALGERDYAYLEPGGQILCEWGYTYLGDPAIDRTPWEAEVTIVPVIAESGRIRFNPSFAANSRHSA